MYRLFGFLSLGIVTLLLSGTSQSQDNPKKDPASTKDREAKLEKMIEKFVSDRNAYARAFQQAKTPQAQKEAEKLKPKAADYQKDLDAFFAENSKDDLALEALTFAFYGLDIRDEKTTKILMDNFAKTDKIKQFVAIASQAGNKEIIPTIQKIVELNMNKEVKAMGLVAVGGIYAMENDQTGDKAARDEAIKAYELAVKDFGDVVVDDQPVKELAKGALFELKNLSLGSPAPATVSTSLEGKPVKLEDYKGKVIVLDIWATWCGPCRAMIPHEREMVERLKDKPFVLISLSADKKKETLTNFLEKEKMPWVHWWEGETKDGILKNWNIRFFPTIYIIDAKGIIRHKGLRGDDMEKAVVKLIEEATKK